MPSPPEPRRARFDDLPDVAKLDRDIFGADGYGQATLRQMVDLMDEGALVSRAGDGSLAGYAFIARAMAPEVFWFMVLAVAPQARRGGVGRALAHRAVDVATAAGAARILLTVHPDNQAAIELYESMGFRHERLEPEYFGAGQPRIVMALEVARAGSAPPG